MLKLMESTLVVSTSNYLVNKHQKLSITSSACALETSIVSIYGIKVLKYTKSSKIAGY